VQWHLKPGPSLFPRDRRGCSGGIYAYPGGGVLRAQFGQDLRIGGGFDKRIVAKGPEVVKTELDRLAPVIREGGFVPGVDHSVPADVSWDYYRRYLDLLVKVTA
jgi:hypothetical protein